MISNFFLTLGLIVIVATLMGLLAKKLKQPILLAYIFTGILLGASALNVIDQQNTNLQEVITLFSEIGIAFLLYLVGLNLNPKILKEVGKAAFTIGLGQIAFTVIIGFFIANLLGFNFLEAIYIAIALTFSSTIIIVKILSDKNELNTLYGKLTIGVLIVQDFVAILALLFIGSLGSGLDVVGAISSFLSSAIIFFALAGLIARYIMPKLFDMFATSQELLFMSGVSWAFFLAGLSSFLNFSIEIGAFVAGVTLASLPYSFEISGKIKPLRDFFLLLFFVTLGSQVVFQSANVILIPAIVFALFVLIGNPLIVIIIMNRLGYKGRTSFMSGLTVAQISEFSLILVAIGFRAGHISQSIVSLVIVVGVFTIAASSYMILHGNRIYDFLTTRFSFMQNSPYFQEQIERVKEKQYDTIFIGFNKLGHSVFHEMGMDKKNAVIIDYDPALLKELKKEGYNCIFGDGGESEVQELIEKANPKTIISTVRNREVNWTILNESKKWKVKPHIILTSEVIRHAIEFYKHGATFVIIPQLLVGRRISDTVNKIRQQEVDIPSTVEQHISHLEDMLKMKID
jgi:Kef-type K+ transport system membrane component KefB